MKDIAIFGAGGFGREVKMLIDQINLGKAKYNFVGFFDDGVEKNTIINSYPVLGGIQELNNISKELSLVCSVANPKTKQKIISNINNANINYPSLIHPSVIIGNDNVNIGEGNIICGGAIITVDIKIGDHIILNLSCTVGHDTKIDSYSSFMPSVNISGEVNINEGVYAGTGVKIINQLKVGEYTTIGAGAVVAKDLPANCTAVGVPAKPIKFHAEND